MDRCTDYQSQMLEYVYDLLDEDAFRALGLHLEDCADCRAALRAAQGQQQLLAAAARVESAAVRFEAPVVVHPQTEAVPETPVRLSLVRPRRRLAWQVWASAAAVLLALGAPAWFGVDYLRARHDLASLQAVQARANAQSDEVARQIERLDREQREQTQTLEREVLESEVRVSVTGPRSYTPDAPSAIQIHTADGLNREVASTLKKVQLIDRKHGKVLLEKQNVQSDGMYLFSIPPHLPVEPDAQLAIQVVAAGGGGSSRLLEEDFPLTPPSYLTHLTTDRPAYQPGETVRFRSLTLERFSLEPAREKLALRYTLTTPVGSVVDIPQADVLRLAESGLVRGAAVYGPEDKARRGIGGGAWDLPPSWPEGEYVLTVSEARNRFPAQRRRFLVQRYPTARLHKELDFTRRSYGPGDELVALCRLSRNGQQPVANGTLAATLTLDGKASGPLRLRTDRDGKAALRFRLPAAIEKGQASLHVAFDDGGGAEGLTRPVHVVLKKLDVAFYPEGGRLVPGARNRVYFQVRTPLGQPAELRGRMLDDRGDEVAQLETLAEDTPGAGQGMGAFWLRPYRNHTYRLKVDSPAGIEGTWTLSTAEMGEVALSVPDAVTAAHEPIVARVRSAFRDRALLIAAYCRGRLFDHRRVVVREGEELAVPLEPARGVGGVCRVTVFEEISDPKPRLVPRAERLVFRQPRERLNLAAVLDRDSYVSGGRARLTVKATDENQQPMAAVAMVAVVDRAALERTGDRTARSLPTHFYLTSEIRNAEELEDADFLLTPHPRAPVALDLLLGTHGWRRFAAARPEAGEPATALAFGLGTMEMPKVTRTAPEWSGRGGELGRQQRTLRERFAAERARLSRRQTELGQELSAARAAPAYLEARQTVEAYQGIADGVRALFPLVGLFLAIAAVLLLGRSLVQPPARAVPYFSAATACVGLLVIGALVAFQGRPTAETPPSTEQPQTAQHIQKEEPPGRDALPAPARFMDEPRGEIDSMKKNSSDKTVVPPPGPAAFDRGVTNIAPGAAPQAPGVKGKAAPVSGGSRVMGGIGGSGFKTPLGEGKGGPSLVPGGGYGFGGFGGFAGGGLSPPPQRSLDPASAAARDGRTESFRYLGQQRAGLVDSVNRVEGKRADVDGKKDVQGRPHRRKLDSGERPRDETPGLFVREFAYRNASEAAAAPRRDYTETVYWHPAVVLPDGKVDVAFDLNDAVTTYQVTVFGHAAGGRLAATTRTFAAHKPLSLDMVTPAEVTVGDRIDVPVTVTNGTGKPQNVVIKMLKHDGLEPVRGKSGLPSASGIPVAAEKQARPVYGFAPAQRPGEALLRFSGAARPFSDDVTRSIRVAPEGFPVVQARSDVLRGQARHEVVLPNSWVKGTLRCRLVVFPTALADLQQGLEALAHRPAVSFERMSASTYSSALLLNHLKETRQARPELEFRAYNLLDDAAQRLAPFDVPQRDLGKDQAGPDKTAAALGLMQLREMARVQAVDPAVLERARRFLYGRSAGASSLLTPPRKPDSFGRSGALADAYVVWALTESGKDDVTRELKDLQGQALTARDSTFVALVANSLANRGQKADAGKLLETVARNQKDDGRVEPAPVPVTVSQGRDLRIETTALCVLGWLKADPMKFKGPIEKGVRWLERQRGGSGAFGSTQATVLALKALAADDRVHKRLRENGELALFVGEKSLARLPFTAQARDALVLDLPDVEKNLKPGANAVRIAITGKNLLPYTLTWSYRTLRPASAAGCPLKLSTVLDRTRAVEGESVRLMVKLENATDKGQGTAVAVVGLPGGLVVPEGFRQLLGYKRPPKDGGSPLLGAFEVRGRELVLSWRELAPRQTIAVPVDLGCRVPGTYRGPASRAYLDADPDRSAWVEPLAITIVPRK